MIPDKTFYINLSFNKNKWFPLNTESFNCTHKHMLCYIRRIGCRTDNFKSPWQSLKVTKVQILNCMCTFFSYSSSLWFVVSTATVPCKRWHYLNTSNSLIPVIYARPRMHEYSIFLPGCFHGMFQCKCKEPEHAVYLLSAHIWWLQLKMDVCAVLRGKPARCWQLGAVSAGGLLR